jgi:hypothetical protein
VVKAEQSDSKSNWIHDLNDMKAEQSETAPDPSRNNLPKPEKAESKTI